MKPYKTLFWACFIISLLLFFNPFPTSAGSGYGLDKDVHAAIFAALVFTALKAFPARKILAVFGLALYAYSTEFIQGRFFPLRHFDWYDITADVVGLLLGLAVYFVNRKRNKITG